MNDDIPPERHCATGLFFLQHWDRPFAQLLSGLETGHPVAVGQSPAYDFSVPDEQKAVFLVTVSDCSECDSSGLDHPNSSWSIARLKKYLRKKKRPELSRKRAEFPER